MMDRMYYQLEVSGGTATLYVVSGLDDRSVYTLIEVCRLLPAHVRTLRLDLSAMGSMTAEATGAVRLLLRHWRDDRYGEFRLSTSYLVATCRQVDAPTLQPARHSWVDSAVNDALTATFL